MAAQGHREDCAGVMPSVTNANNASLCCGHGRSTRITANFFLDETTGQELYMESADLCCVPRCSSGGETWRRLRAAFFEEENGEPAESWRTDSDVGEAPASE